jgi:hypothetical protein
MPEYGRAIAEAYQIDDPWAPIVIQPHSIIAWRLLFPVLSHYLRLPNWLYFAMPHLGCVLVLWLAAWLAQKRFGDWRYTWMTVTLLAALPWFFVSTGWLGYFDSWLVLGMLVISFVPSTWALAATCLISPWIDERIVLALPVCITVRTIVLHGLDNRPWGKLRRDYATVVIASLVYPLIRAVALVGGDSMAPNYVSAHWKELQSVPWDDFLDGWWSGYRAAWLVIAVGFYFCGRQAGWIWAAALAIATVLSAIVALFIAADMSRSMMIVIPTLFLGIWLWHESQPRTFAWGLPAILIANLLLPTAHVMWNLRIPIHSFPTVWTGSMMPHLDPEVYTRNGHKQLAAGNLDDARKAFDTALRLDDHYAPAYLLRAAQRLRQDDLIGAQTDIRDALRLTPDLPDALFLSAVIAQRLNDLPTARTNVQKALEIAPSDWRQRSQAELLRAQLESLPDR